MFKFSLIVAFIILLNSCALMGIFLRDNLHIKKVDQTSSINKINLKVDGVFVFDQEMNTYFTRNFLFLFRNGTCYYWGYGASNEEEKKYAEKLYFEQNNLPQSSPIGWGIYKIVSDSLHIEYWSSGFGTKYARNSLKGKVLNENTIQMDINKRELISAIFIYQPLKIKPDSTNRFVK